MRHHITNVATYVTVDVDRLSVWSLDRVVGILPSDTLSLFLERLDGRVCPPVPKPSALIVLSASVVKRMTELVSCDGQNTLVSSALTQVAGNRRSRLDSASHLQRNRKLHSSSNRARRR
jgi:hypothetical protein